MGMHHPLVSVHIITYNQAPYIAAAIEGALQQQTDFGVEIIVGEDCSTDGTREIALEYQRQCPERVRVITSPHNVGVHENSRRVREACRGKYLAVCDGDDYWTDPRKLQKQVDFLEAHPRYSLCCHDVEIIYDGVPQTPKTDRYVSFTKDTFSFEDAVEDHFIPTLSIVCWREPAVRVPEWYRECISGDVPMELLLLDRGLGYYLHETMGVKRDNPGGISFDPARRAQVGKNFLQMYKRMNAYTQGRHRAVLRRKIARLSLKLAHEGLDAGRYGTFLRYLLESLRYDRKAVYAAAQKRLPGPWRGSRSLPGTGAGPHQVSPIRPCEKGCQRDA